MFVTKLCHGHLTYVLWDPYKLLSRMLKEVRNTNSRGVFKWRIRLFKLFISWKHSYIGRLTYVVLSCLTVPFTLWQRTKFFNEDYPGGTSLKKSSRYFLPLLRNIIKKVNHHCMYFIVWALNGDISNKIMKLKL